MSLQKFLDYDNVSICYSGKQNTKLKYNTNCILRMGIGMNKNQSFLECLSNMYNHIPILLLFAFMKSRQRFEDYEDE